MKIVFFGTPKLSVSFLEALAKDKDFEVLAVVTQPDKEAGRGKKITPPEVKIVAEKFGISVLQFASLKKEEAQNQLRSLGADLFVVVAYGKIIPSQILSIPPMGVINVHPSLLPKYRGPSPIQFAILNSDKTTGISIMLLDEGMDTGPVIAQKTIELDLSETSTSLEEKICKIGPEFLVETIKCFSKNECKAVAQDEKEATVTSLLTRDDGKINWHKTDEEIVRMVRAFQPWPGVWTLMKTDKETVRVKILSIKLSQKKFQKPAGVIIQENKEMFVQCKNKAVEIITLQPEGKQPMSAQAFLAGRQDWIWNAFES